MKVLKIIGVPEHFNFPWRSIVDKQPLLDQGVSLSWQDESRGSGQMINALTSGEVDLGIILTESFLKAFQEEKPLKMIGYHVNSPLCWGIHVGKNSKINSLDEVKSPSFFISREGSGSHLMASVLAEREKWSSQSLEYKIVDNLDGALSAFEKNPDGLFLWEKFTTKPYVDQGLLNRLGEIPSPWPCFAIIASEKAMDEFGETIFQLRDLVYEKSKTLKNSTETVKAISSSYHLAEEDVKAWLSQTNWAQIPEISISEFESAMEIMVRLGILKAPIPLENCLTTDRLRMIP
ncbi:type 2 periplasmic-binding domain-containing protein [Algoriphagus hitonicola]|uniref:ABC-type nitrate/sulfonate/bicarbonate transport system, substrate-binding protein n=1 Tax=Algoriphagus hitonicola TaxID=435880 RepID=A0A1I2WVE3_9BACT|nr:ABC transporter substrate-binding protein [Algoriphagus hitonicola]SFH05314.1 ABC-type nitrate/sulfonate/bicarbonate transport system, substrate-binding protein [Algoriphagus hitonicola]